MATNLTYLSSTACALLGIDPPEHATAEPRPEIISAAPAKPVERMLIYAPDAIGYHIIKRYNAELDAVREHAPVELELTSMMPSFTPVCFASLFTGAEPDVHGIGKYEKPQLKIDTFFDAVTRSGKRIALAAVADSSMDTIFRAREYDHFTEIYDPYVTHRARKLIEANEHDVVVAYHQQYDDHLHLTDPFSPEALHAFRLHLLSFARLARHCAKHWKGHSYALAFTPDHGAHYDEEKGMGYHGTDSPEDQELIHFWGFGG